MPPENALPILDRSRFRWINGLGFAITVCVAAWVLIALFGLASGVNVKDVSAPPRLYLFVAGVAMLALLGSFAYVLRFFWQGADMGRREPRTALYIWSLVGTLCFAVLGLILLQFKSPGLPRVPQWAMQILWFLTIPGLLVFGSLCYVNADLPTGDDTHYDDDEDTNGDDAYEDEAYDDAPYDDDYGHEA